MNDRLQRHQSLSFRLAVALILLTPYVAGCGASSRILLPGGSADSLEHFLAQHPLADGENIKPAMLARGEHSSLHIVQVRDREAPHVHTRYDLTVTVVRGHGTLWLDGKPRPMRRGDAAFVPRGAPHYFVNEDDEPAVALVTFAPAFDGPDTQPLR